MYTVKACWSKREQTAKAWVDSSKGKLRHVVVHIGAGNLRDSRELAAHAQSIGADAISAVTPTYYKPANEDVLMQYMAEVAAAAPETPFYYYDISFVTGVTVNVTRFLELAKGKIPTLVGVKHSSLDLSDQQSILLLEDGKYQVMIGTFDGYLPALSYGVDVPLAPPFAGDIYHALKTAYDAGDFVTAKENQVKTVTLTRIVKKHGGKDKFPAAVKTTFSMLSGVEAGPVRLPLLGLTSSEKAALREELKSAGFLE
ncbi:hypothetical protein ScPMuIL_004634 [Solemya velum]